MLDELNEAQEELNNNNEQPANDKPENNEQPIENPGQVPKNN